MNNVANEIILIGDVHANELKVLDWQLECRQYRDDLPVGILDYPSYMLMGDTFTSMKDVDLKKCREAMDKLAKLMIEHEVHFDTRTNR